MALYTEAGIAIGNVNVHDPGVLLPLCQVCQRPVDVIPMFIKTTKHNVDAGVKPMSW